MKPPVLIACAFICAKSICLSDVDYGEIKELSSPRNEYLFNLIDTKTPGLQGLVISKNKHELSNSIYFIQGYFINGIWNSSLDYVAINNRHSNGGDYIWLFSLPTGYAIKQPEDYNAMLICAEIAKSYPEYSFEKLRGSYTFAYKWKSINELLVCNILISNLDHQGIVVAYDTYVIGKYGGYSITDRTAEKLSATEFKQLPKITTLFWSGWDSTWWETLSTEPAREISK